MELGGLRLGQSTVLRRFILRTSFNNLPDVSFPALHKALKTIRSPVFSEFVLELGTPKSMLVPNNRPEICGDWRYIDRRFARCGGVRLVIRTGGIYEDGMFRERAKDVFPLMAKSGRVSFETSPSVNEYWV
jgi:hypothetical protein